MKFGLIGQGAIASHVQDVLSRRAISIDGVIVRPQRLAAAKEKHPDIWIGDAVEGMPGEVTHVIECAGHGGLVQHGESVLASGRDLIIVSVGALADRSLYARLKHVAGNAGSTLHIASGAIGGLDVLRSAATADVASVVYTARKPPVGWQGSAAENVVDLDSVVNEPVVHFDGSAREASALYPKNANVAAAVALAGVGFDKTVVQLVADPGVSQNIHEIHASGEFGSLSVQVCGNTLPDNPRSSALAAMSVVAKVIEQSEPIRF